MMQDPLVLIADGRISVRMALSDALRKAGFYVISAATGLDVLRLAQSASPEAVVVGGSFPDFEGGTVKAFMEDDDRFRAISVHLLPDLSDGPGEAGRAWSGLLGEILGSLACRGAGYEAVCS